MARTKSLLRVAVFAAGFVAPAESAAAGFSWSEYARKPDAWFRSAEGLRIAANVLSYQSPHGGWPKNTDMTKSLAGGDPKEIQPTFDNGATYGHLRFVARAFRTTGDTRFKESFERGLDYIFAAQYPNGGWPQFFPLKGGYANHITFNDGAMIGVLRILTEVATGKDFDFVDATRRARARAACDRGIECILACQVVVKDVRTVWCAQHDARTLEPRPARSYEKASLSGGESAGIIFFLMEIANPNPAVIQAVENACAWYERSAIRGIRVVAKDGDKVVVEDSAAAPLWARFYDIATGRPIFCGRDGIVKQRLADIDKERRTGYAWYVDAGADVLSRWPAWRARVGAASRSTR